MKKVTDEQENEIQQLKNGVMGMEVTKKSKGE